MKSFLDSSLNSFAKVNKKRKCNNENVVNDINDNNNKKQTSLKTVTSSSSSSSSSSSLTSTKVLSSKSNLKQMFLDLGQKSFGRNKLCQLCGMLYVIGNLINYKLLWLLVLILNDNFFV